METVTRTSRDLYGRGQNYARNHPRVVTIVVAVLAWIILELIMRRFLPVPVPHVSLSGQPLSSTGPSWFTNSLLTTFIVDAILIIVAVIARARLSLVPSGIGNAVEAVIEYLYKLAESVSGNYARRFFPWVATLFLLVIISNWSGVIPGVGSIGFVHGATSEAGGEHALAADRQLAMANGSLILVEPTAQSAQEEQEKEYEVFVPLFRAPSADLNMTFALAISTMVMVQIWGVRVLGPGYFRKFWNTSGKGFLKGINIFVSFLELLSEFARIVAFGFRLFGNIFAGEIVLATMAFLVAFLVPLPFYALEIFVGFVQALVFMMLALGFFTMATISHGHEEHGQGERGHEAAAR